MTESMDSSHSWVSVGSISSNGDCCVIEMHTHPRVLLRWQARYSAPALTAIKLTWVSSGFGFSRSSKVAIPLRFYDMPTRLPLDRLLWPVRQIGARVNVTKLARYPSALLLLPLKPSDGDWKALPHAALLRALYERKGRKAGDCFP